MAASGAVDDSQISYQAIHFSSGLQKHKNLDTGFGFLFIKRFNST